jgi:endo-1,3(4)-beta-glucanase
MSTYALKMWGQITGDVNMQARGNLMLAIQARSLQSYYLTSDDNTVQPAQYIGNRAAGILFDNKIDHTTYFGDNPEYVEGIHMLPLMPFSAYIRTPTLVAQEWTGYFSGGRVSSIVGGWRGVLMANYAIVDPVAAWDFFADANFDPSHLDGGASRTWYLAWSAALGGV